MSLKYNNPLAYSSAIVIIYFTLSQNSVKYPSSGVDVLDAANVYYWSGRAIADNEAPIK